ncbi:MAG: PilZ domain-containing protein [Pseudomonadota bacterium]
MSTTEPLQTLQPSPVKHASPMLRSAKVVCQSGEYICLVRDVSDTGVLLSYLHDVPTEPRIILSLGNGQTYPIQRIWSGDTQAGYRFAGSMSLEEFLHEKTPFTLRPVRLTIAASARVIDGSEKHDARLRDMSTHGASFDCGLATKAVAATPIPTGRRVTFQAHSMRPHGGQIVWHERSEKGWRYGLQFESPLTLRQLAQGSVRMQPFGPCALKDPLQQPIPVLGSANAA